MKKTYCVYCHTNLINGKKYIGQTCRKPQLRWGVNGIGYLKKNKKGLFNQPLFANAILKYGWDNFSHEIIASNLTQEEANKLEFELINLYNTQDDEFGYNIVDGGIKCDYTNLTRQIHLKMQDEEYLNRMRDKWTQILKDLWNNDDYRQRQIEKGKKLAEAMWNDENYKKKMCKRVKCVETNITYNSCLDAQRATNIHVSNIARCVKGERKTAGGYHWILIEEGESNG